MSSINGVSAAPVSLYSRLNSSEFVKQVYIQPLLVQAVAMPIRRRESQDPVTESLVAALEYDYARKALKPALEKFSKIDVYA